MTTSLVNRLPIPGSLGVSAASHVSFLVSTDDSISRDSLNVVVDGLAMVVAGVLSTTNTQAGSSITTDGSGGWTVVLVPTDDLTYGTEVVVTVTGEESSEAFFTDTFSFLTVRDLVVAAAAFYVEKDSVVYVDFFVHEDQVKTTDVAVRATISLSTPSGALGGSDIVLFRTTQDVVGCDDAGAYRFCLRNPIDVRADMTCAISVEVDPYEAPGVSPLTLSQEVVFREMNNSEQMGHLQPSQAINTTEPRFGQDYTEANRHQVNVNPAEQIDLGENDREIMVDIDFSAADFPSGTYQGDIEYAGGGHRLLPSLLDGTNYLVQDSGVLPWSIGAKTILEPASTNLLVGSDLATDLYTVTGTDTTVVTEKEYQDFSDQGVRVLKLTATGMASFDRTIDRRMVIATPKVPITLGTSFRMGTLLRVEPLGADVTLPQFKLRTKFFNSSNALVGSQQVVFQTEDFESQDAFSLVEMTLIHSQFTSGTTQVSMELDFGNFEEPDRIVMYLAAPSVEVESSTLSRIVGPTSVIRGADIIQLAKSQNIVPHQGRLGMKWIPGYTGSPLTATTLFDSRSPSTGYDGMLLQHRADGKVEFRLVDSGGTAHTVVSPSNWVSEGELVTFQATWADGIAKVNIDGAEVLSGSGSSIVPTGVSGFMALGCSAVGGNQLRGQLIGVQILRSLG